MQPWDADRDLSPETALDVIRDQFPEVDARCIRRLGSGWDNDVYEVDERWVFRFPRRREVARTVDREAAVIASVAPSLERVGVATPVVHWHGRPCARFPHPFLGGVRVPGVALDTVAGRSTPDLATQLGGILGVIHDTEDVPPSIGTKAPRDEAWLARIEEQITPALRTEPAEIRDRWVGLSTTRDIPPGYTGTPRLLHNDICPDHVLVDAEKGAIVGLIDWGDTVLGDPMFDFVTIPMWLGWPAARTAFDAYPLPVDSGFHTRWEFLTPVYSLIWLHEAIARGGDVAKHRDWVRRAFAL